MDKLKSNKPFGFFLFGIGILFSIGSMIFLPIPIYGLFLLLRVFKPGMGKAARIIIAFVVPIAIVVGISTLMSL